MTDPTYDRREDGKVLRNISVTVPERRKKEDPITANQLAYIQGLAPGWEPDGGLEGLGKWQASAIISQLVDAKKTLEADIATGNVREGLLSEKNRIFWIRVGVVVVPAVIFILIYR